MIVIERGTLAQYLKDFLACENFQDYAPNGLQVEGKFSIDKICTAVSASESAIQYAINVGADTLLVHHGYFWRDEDAVVTGTKYKKIALLIKHNINLFAYHLPLDAHPLVGNNAMIGKLLGLEELSSYNLGKIPGLLWQGILPQALNINELQIKLKNLFNNNIIHLGDKKHLVQKLAWCSGAAQNYFMDPRALNADAYLTGEVSERNYYEALETKRSFFACGHHATEKFGVQALGEHLKQKFDIEHHFYDSKNPV